MTNANLAALSASGVSVWLDDLSRDLLDSGELAGYLHDLAVVGVTSNPAIFRAAICDSPTYDAAISTALSRNSEVEAVLADLTTTDVRDACDLLAPVYDRSGGVDGRVSLEVDPRFAHDARATIAQARELADMVGRDNLLIKIPATETGLTAISEVVGGGLDVNVTLIFSAERYRAVAEAFLTGLELAAAAGHDLSRLHSVASVFVSRLDTAVDEQLDPESALRGRAGMANARLCHAIYEELFERGDRFAALAERGARPQRLLWASTGTKNPDYPDTLYVTGLVTTGVVTTVPLNTLRAFADHGKVLGDTVRGTSEESRRVLDEIAAHGVHLPDVFDQLEARGLETFVAAWEALVEAVRDRIAAEGAIS